VSTDVTLKAQSRTDFGKGAARALRRQGLVPAVMYGSGSQLRHIVLPEHETNLALRIAQVVLRVEIDGKTLPVAPRDVQRDPVRTDLLHLDLILLSLADVEERHAFNDALALAQANAEEAGLDPTQAAKLIEDAAAEGTDIGEAAANIVETLQAQARAFTEQAEAAEAAEAVTEGGEAEQAEAGEAAAQE
jgi:large subunit ribosomal protein L25